MNYYNEIKNRLLDNEIYSKVKDYSKERHKVMTYFEIGRLLNDAGGKYGDHIIDEYSKKLVLEVGKKYNRRTLFRMKQFYSIFHSGKVSTLSTQLSWSHYTELLPIKNENEMLYYFKLCINQHIDVRSLREKIKNKEYSKNKSETETYYNVGRLIIEAQKGEVRAKYGTNLIKEYSEKLIDELNDKKYSYRNLMNMRKFYLVFCDEKVNALRSQLTWSHYRELITIKNVDEIKYYINLAVSYNLGYRELAVRIRN